MKYMEILQIKQKIREKWPNDYIQEHALLVTLEDIEKLSEPLRTEFEKFLETGDLPDLEVEGWNLERLMKEKNLHPVGAFLMLDWLKKEPQKAKQILARGFDSR